MDLFTYFLLGCLVILLFCLAEILTDGQLVYKITKPFKKITHKKVITKKEPKVKKTIEAYENKVGDKYYIVTLEDKSTEIKWDNYDDALFYYNHIKSMPTKHYIYDSINKNKYYIIYLDKCGLYVVPEEEYDDYHYNGNLTKNPDQAKKYIVFLHDKYRPRLEKYYNNIVDKDYFEKKTVLSTEQIEQELEEAVDLSDVEKLKKIVNEYKQTVEMQNAMTNMLVKICKSDYEYNGKNKKTM